MKWKRNKLILFFMLLFATISGAMTGAIDVKAVSGEYLLKPMGGSDTVNIGSGSYMVTGTPGQEATLQLMVLNKASNTRKFMYMVNTAYTNDAGQLEYDKSKVTDPSLKIQTANTASPRKQEFTVPGKTNATIAFKITIPKKAFKGTIMGGVTVYPYKEKAKGTVSSNGTLIKNKFSYSIPIQIHQKDADSDEAKYSITAVRPGTVSASDGLKPGVQANVHNSSNSYTGVLSSKAVVTKKGDKSFKITNTSSTQEIAPTSNYNYQISWGKKRLQAGDYHLKMVYKAPGGLKSWTLNKDFTITNNDAAKYNKLAGIKPNYLWLYILLAILALAIILGLGVYLGKRNNNKNNGNNGNNMNNNGGNTTRRRRR
ncbi:DUF3324 domain-containing protein [Companilactobacillus heilongjiangensis]|uniref:Uncharacterized protein n=1 Tax=Companilactobacillus heilongjiangensis TaxID=1074467 RepID=A0A0K2LEA4_9LACO|nr:DUF3324 domain-containing protein [Companilactobacillus heilongjiangensis]ALB29528.1 hypothetical protein JP39_09295 [Companilactobacillus heilongjiangensis]